MKSVVNIFLFLFVLTIKAQNIVPNNSFEEYIICPNSLGQISYTKNWYSPISIGSPDFFNSCSQSHLSSVPSNVGYYGFQYPFSGSGYISLFCSQQSFSNDVREYVAVKLDSLLLSSKKYYVSYYVSLIEISQKSISTFGAYFSQTDSFETNGYMLVAEPQVENPLSRNIADTMNWVQISGSFIAQGGEQYLTIGNFKDDNHCGLQNYPNGGFAAANQAYYYIDDVCVSTNPADCGIDTSSPTNLPKGDALGVALRVFPNPTRSTVTLQSSSNNNLHWALLDITGKELGTGSFTKQTSIDVESYAKGVYLLGVNDEAGNSVVKRFFKE